MRVEWWFARAFELTERLRVACAALAFAALACTTTLDPTIVAGDGAAGSGADPLAQCTTIALEDDEFLLCAEPLPFAAAAHDCSLRGAALVAIGSAEEQQFVTANVARLAGDKWLGGSRDDQLVWSWPDGTVFWRGGPDGMAEDGMFVSWNSGEPNDASTTSSDPERCLALTPAGDWNDRACELPLPYVCERPRETR